MPRPENCGNCLQTDKLHSGTQLMCPKYAEITFVCFFFFSLSFKYSLQRMVILYQFEMDFKHLRVWAETCLSTVSVNYRCSYTYPRVALRLVEKGRTLGVWKGRGKWAEKGRQVGLAISTGWTSRQIVNISHCSKARLSLQLLFLSKIWAIPRSGYPITRTCNTQGQELGRGTEATQHSCGTTGCIQPFGYYGN